MPLILHIIQNGWAKNRPEDGEFSVNFPVRREMQPETSLVQTASTTNTWSPPEAAHQAIELKSIERNSMSIP
jgi:hypothetical protein